MPSPLPLTPPCKPHSGLTRSWDLLSTLVSGSSGTDKTRLMTTGSSILGLSPCTVAWWSRRREPHRPRFATSLRVLSSCPGAWRSGSSSFSASCCRSCCGLPLWSPRSLMRSCRLSLGPFGVMSHGGARADMGRSHHFASPVRRCHPLPCHGLLPHRANVFLPRIMRRCSASESFALWVASGSPPCLMPTLASLLPPTKPLPSVALPLVKGLNPMPMMATRFALPLA